MGVTIAREALDQILDMAAANPDAEICGLLTGTANAVCHIVPCANVSRDPSRQFEVDPAVLFATIRQERLGGPALIGHYHSHPSGETMPSMCDAAMADRPGRLWLIAAGSEARLWRECPDGSVHGAFESCALVVEGGCA